MQASNAGRLLAAQTGAAKALYAIVITTLLLFWLNQDSISLYCQQKYHQSCELPVLGQSPAWRLGGNLTHALGDARDSFIDSLEKRSEPVLVAKVEASDTVELPAPVQVVAVHLDKPPVCRPRPRQQAGCGQGRGTCCCTCTCTCTCSAGRPGALASGYRGVPGGRR
ncbi:UNVERIFIED_ORG: hypothetical protein OKW25_004704 [Pseudomonas vranovensis]|nr:hypothetical protein [Pseudomonas vranovensis]